MIVLITGASHTGKTLLSQKLLEKYKYPYLSIDHLKMGLIRSKNTDLTPTSDDVQLTKYLWPIVREIIKTAIENKQNLIVEGCYVPYDYKKDFDTKYLVFAVPVDTCLERNEGRTGRAYVPRAVIRRMFFCFEFPKGDNIYFINEKGEFINEPNLRSLGSSLWA
jgi:predicted kinase